eukprot:768732-Hanusia_phi.AAC.7
MFQSVYYAEAGCGDMEQSRDKGSRPCVLSRGRLEPLMAPRRRGQSIKQPTSKAEETRMIMAAVRASLQEIRGRQQEDDGGHDDHTAMKYTSTAKLDAVAGSRVVGLLIGQTCNSTVS